MKFGIEFVRSGVLKNAPGVITTIFVAISATFLSEHYGGPIMLFSLLLGMTCNFLSSEDRFSVGIEFASTQILRVAVGLLGAQLTFSEIIGLGATPLLLVLSAIIITIISGLLVAGAMGLGRSLGILTGGAVAICGASAALAISTVLPKHESSERDTIFTVISVTTLSTIAMIFYPILIAMFNLDQPAVGVFLGATIHDVAQVVGAGFSVSEEVGNIATLTKLLRVTMLLPVMLFLTYLFRRAVLSNSAGARLPWFLVLFALLLVLNSVGLLPSTLEDLIKSASRWLLVIAIAALGMKTSFKMIANLGWRPVFLVVSETVFLATLALVAVIWFL